MKFLKRFLDKPISKTSGLERVLLGLLAFFAVLAAVVVGTLVWIVRLIPLWLILGVIYWLWG